MARVFCFLLSDSGGQCPTQTLYLPTQYRTMDFRPQQRIMSAEECYDKNIPYPLLCRPKNADGKTRKNADEKTRKCDEKVAALPPLPLCPKHPKSCSCIELYAMQNSALEQIRHYYTQTSIIGGGMMADSYLISMLVASKPKRSRPGSKETITWRYKVPNILPILPGEAPRCAIYYPCRKQFQNLFGLSEKRLCNLQYRSRNETKQSPYRWKGHDFVAHGQVYKGTVIELGIR